MRPVRIRAPEINTPGNESARNFLMEKTLNEYTEAHKITFNKKVLTSALDIITRAIRSCVRVGPEFTDEQLVILGLLDQIQKGELRYDGIDQLNPPGILKSRVPSDDLKKICNFCNKDRGEILACLKRKEPEFFPKDKPDVANANLTPELLDFFSENTLKIVPQMTAFLRKYITQYEAASIAAEEARIKAEGEREAKRRHEAEGRTESPGTEAKPRGGTGPLSDITQVRRT